MGDSALLKVDRAAKHIVDLNELLRKRRPFFCVLKTNHKTGERSICTEEDEAIADEIAVCCGDVLHNLRSALDHAYFRIVSACVDRKAVRSIQFPFCETEAGLEEAVKQRLAQQVSNVFFKALVDLKPYAEQGGNEDLHLIHSLNLIDKHKLLTPTCDHTVVHTSIVRQQVPDFPESFQAMIGFGGNGGADISWYIPKEIIVKIPPFDKKLDIPVDIVFAIAGRYPRRVVPTLLRLVEVAKSSIATIRAAAAQ